jgi:hypothetical protein
MIARNAPSIRFSIPDAREHGGERAGHGIDPSSGCEQRLV